MMLIEIYGESINFGGTHQIDTLSKIVMGPHHAKPREAAHGFVVVNSRRVRSHARRSCSKATSESTSGCSTTGKDLKHS